MLIGRPQLWQHLQFSLSFRAAEELRGPAELAALDWLRRRCSAVREVEVVVRVAAGACLISVHQSAPAGA